MRKLYALSMSTLALLVCFLCTPAPARGQDYNYSEKIGNVTSVSTTTDFNIYTQQSVLREVVLTLWTKAPNGADAHLTVKCPTNGTAVSLLCQNRQAMLTGYCPTQVFSSTCFPDQSGNCTFHSGESCVQGTAGKCVRVWGYDEAAGGQQWLFADYVLTRTQSTCSPKP